MGDKIEDFVDALYLSVLGRPPDEEGRNNYAQLIREGKLENGALETILRSSDEYHDRITIVRDNRDISTFVKTKFVEILRRPADVGGLVHYTKEIAEGRLKKEDLVDVLKNCDEYKARIGDGGITIAFCQGTYGERVHETLSCLNRVHPGVDVCIIIVDDTVTEEQRQQLRDVNPEKVHVMYRAWEDDFPAMRNEYLREARKEGVTYVAVSDPDELYGEDFVRDLRDIIETAEDENTTLLLINAHDVLEKDGEEKQYVSSFYKNLIFKICDKVRYEGIGEAKNVHERLVTCDGLTKSLPLQYFYQHRKKWIDIKERGARNIWIGGGGNNVGSSNPHYVRLREITDRLGLRSWKEVREYVRKGNVDKELLDWIISIKDVTGADYINETRDFFVWYSMLYPDDIAGASSNPQPLAEGSYDEVMKFVEESFLKILGRHADDEAKVRYTEAIMKGEVKRDELEGILKESEEYKERFG